MKLVRFLALVFLLAIVGCGGNSTPAPQPTPLPTITGSWAGSATSQVQAGAVSNITGGLTQGVTKPDGSILFSGTLNLTNSCVSTLSISGKIAGSAFALSGTFSDGSTLDVTANINATDTQITGNYNQVGGSVCASDHGTFALSKK